MSLLLASRKYYSGSNLAVKCLSNSGAYVNLLPRMGGVFGKWDWVMNGLLFGLYHLHQPWGIFSAAIEGILLFSLPSRYFRTSWFGIIAHSGQSIFFAILLLRLVLGLA